MTITDTGDDWQRAITHHYNIDPTFNAMQRLLLFGLRSDAVQSSEPEPGSYETVVEREGDTWTGTGATPAEGMARALLAMAQAEAAAPA